MKRLLAIAFATATVALPALAQQSAEGEETAPVAQRNHEITCPEGDSVAFPGKSLGDVFGKDWPADAAAAQVAPRLLARGAMAWPQGMNPQGVSTVVAVLVGPDGKPVRAELLCSNRPGFGASVRRHAMASTYAPGEADGKPVAAVLIRVIGQGKGSTPGQDRMTPQGSLPGRR